MSLRYTPSLPVCAGCVPLALAAAPAAAFDIDRAEADIHWLVSDIGPRPAGSPAEAAAAAGIRERLTAAGWTPTTSGLANTVLACRGAGQRLFLAHLDSVEGSPGAIDNAAGVAVLLELARSTTATDLCLGFPAAEEEGLVGSREMAEAAARHDPAYPSGVPRLTVAMDLAGQGNLAMMGLGPAWTDERLAWLTQTLDPLPIAPFPYRVYSRLLPWAERSDHAPFAWYGGLSLHFLGQGESDVFPRYHQPSDTTWDRAALVDLATALEQLAAAPLPPAEPVPDNTRDRQRAPLDAGVIVGGWAVPSGVVWATIVFGLASAAWDIRRDWRGLPRQLGVGLMAALLAGLHMALLTSTSLFSTTEGEQTAAAVMGTAPTGWWQAAPFAVALGTVLWLTTRAVFAGTGSASLGAGLTTLAVLYLDPVFAFPFAASALLARLHPLLALLPAAMLLAPSVLRQFTFHGLVGPAYWGLFWLVAWPAAIKKPPPPLSNNKATQ